MNVKFFDWDYLHLTALMKETYFKRDPETFEHVTGHENFGNCPSDCPNSEEAQARFDEKVEQANILGIRGSHPTTTKGRLK